jgi:HPt (histidine-containing phosphotransfer) domain-containing protein
MRAEGGGMSIRDELTAVLVRHRGWLAVRIEQIAACIDASTARSQAADHRLAHALELVHQIKGTSGSVGFVEVSQAAEALESHLKSMAAEPDAGPADEAVARAWDLLAALQARADSARPDRSKLLSELGE